MDRRKFLISSGATLAASAGLTTAGFGKSSDNDNKKAALIAKYKSNKPIVTQSNDLSPYTGNWTDTALRHLLRRSMFGVPLSQFQAAQALGSMSAVVDKLLTDLPLPAKPS